VKNTLHNTRKSLRAGTALRALALIGASAGAAVAFAAPAAAQDYTSGTIAGTVADEAGSPVAGATVTVTSAGQGFTRTATTGSSGSFRFNALPAGSYNVVVEAPGLPTYTANAVPLLASQTANLEVLLVGGEEIVVQGQAVADFGGTTTGLNVDVAELVKTTPIGRDLTSVVLLAPGTSGGDSAFGNLASIGGSSVAENAYYINGLNITNFDNYLGSVNVPFEFYRSVEVKSGGYPAEFGRATGGIINSTTKSGSNDFMAAVHVNWTPNFLQEQGKDLTLINSDGSVTRTTQRAYDTNDSYSAIVEAGGPIIKDRLFVYGLAEFRRSESQTVAPVSGTAYRYLNDDPFWGAKVDAYPIDGHHLEFTIFDTRNTTTRSDVAYSQDADGSNPVYGLANSVQETRSGGVNYVAKYTGNLTDFLTVSGAYGRMRDRFDNVGVAGAAGLPVVRNATGATYAGVPYLGYYNGQRTISTSFPYDTEREFYRADVDLFFEAFGSHHIRAGFDVENNTLVESSIRTGGEYLFGSGYMSSAAYNAGSGGAGIYYLIRPSTTSGTTNGVASGIYAELNYFNSGGGFDAENKAFYIQDEWNVTDRLTVNLGLRRDDFGVNKADGSTLVTLSENYAPRLGFTYDLWGGKEGKFYGSYSEYFLPFASNTAFRMTGNEYYLREAWTVTGFDSNGVPILGSQVTNLSSYQSACPFALTPSSSGANCSVTGDGTVADTSALLAHNLEATKESEWILGYEHSFGPWTVGLNYTHRSLDNTAEDSAIDAAVLAYCTANGITGCSSTWTGFHQYVIINPGKDVVVNLDGLDGREVTFSAEDLGYPKATRTYDAVEFTFRRAYQDGWTVGGSYTWSESKGNSEGFVQSDFGQDDAGITQDFDQPGFTEYAYGYLPNHRRHRFKLWGSVDLSDAFTIGTNLSLQSPRKLSCLGYHPTDPFANAYGAASHYCGGQPAPRGEGYETDWITQFDIALRYNIEVPTGQTVTLRADVFNLFNSQGIQERDETGELGVGVADLNYGNPSSYQTPRYVRLGFDIAF
tara:strand:+ start:1075 stop:4185 length:3111 start_codon:yes stop_codon:yes gene_type:complete